MERSNHTIPTFVVLAIAVTLALAVPATANHLDSSVLGEADEGDLGIEPRDGEGGTASLTDLYGDTIRLTQGLDTDAKLSFHLHTPNEVNLDGSTPDNFALLFDTDANGIADFQVIFNPRVVDANDGFAYLAVNGCGFNQEAFPAGFTAEIVDDQNFLITVPVEAFLDGGLDYRYAAYNIDQGTDTPDIGPDTTVPQVHMPIPETTDIFGFEETGCFSSSINYAQATLGLWALPGMSAP